MGRMEHILGRYEYDAGTFYQKMLDNAANYHEMEIHTRCPRRPGKPPQDYGLSRYQSKKRTELPPAVAASSFTNAYRSVPEGPVAYHAIIRTD